VVVRDSGANRTSVSSNGYVPNSVSSDSAADDVSDATMLRVFLWLFVIGAVIYGVIWYKARRDTANAALQSKRNYSL
jgi:heme/copper-type cytochrome/quinol oxidase subunit 2